MHAKPLCPLTIHQNGLVTGINGQLCYSFSSTSFVQPLPHVFFWVQQRSGAQIVSNWSMSHAYRRPEEFQRMQGNILNYIWSLWHGVCVTCWCLSEPSLNEFYGRDMFPSSLTSAWGRGKHIPATHSFKLGSDKHTNINKLPKHHAISFRWNSVDWPAFVKLVKTIPYIKIPSK